MKMKNLFNILIIMLFLCAFAACKDNDDKEEEVVTPDDDKITLPSENSIKSKLGNNYSFTVTYISGEETEISEYYIVSDSYYVNVKGSMPTAYMYLGGDENSFYLGTEEGLYYVGEGNQFEDANGMEYLAFASDLKALEVGTSTIQDRQCKKYQYVTETNEYDFYIDSETGICMQCISKGNNTYYEWTISNLKIGGVRLDRFYGLIQK